MIFSEAPEFTKDVKRLQKKWRSIPDDLQAAKRYIIPLYEELAKDVSVEVYRTDFFAGKRAAILHTADGVEVVKMRLDVTERTAKDKVRIVFVAVKTEGEVRFIEMYAKNEKAREDKTRIDKYIKR